MTTHCPLPEADLSLNSSRAGDPPTRSFLHHPLALQCDFFSDRESNKVSVELLGVLLKKKLLSLPLVFLIIFYQRDGQNKKQKRTLLGLGFRLHFIMILTHLTYGILEDEKKVAYLNLIELVCSTGCWLMVADISQMSIDSVFA